MSENNEPQVGSEQGTGNEPEQVIVKGAESDLELESTTENELTTENEATNENEPTADSNEVEPLDQPLDIERIDQQIEAGKKAEKKKKEKKDQKDAPITPIIKKIKKHGHGHHGGSWKIAYADFVTAMMAFFLLMWLVASLNKAQKAGIADYFKKPLTQDVFSGKNTDSGGTKGGGPDVTQTEGTVNLGKAKVQAKEKELVDSKADEIKKLEELKSEINLSMEKDPALAGLKKQLLMDIVADGLRIQLVDNQKKPMFDVGSEKVNPDVMPILSNIAKLLNSVNNKVTIQGHTDATPYSNPEELDYTNWELSSQRANAARRALIKAGMDENKVMSVCGYSSTVLLDTSNPYNPENRRISIIVMKKGAEEKITKNK